MTTWLRRSAAWASLLGIVACGYPGMRAAEQGDRERLAKELAGPHVRGDISNEDAAALARAVVEHGLAGPHDAASVERVRELEPCAADLGDLFEDLARHDDAAGGEAALALQDLGKISEGEARSHRAATDPRWRAVAARAFVRSQDQKARRDAIVDPDPRVRANGLRASAASGDASDLDLVFETARRDPDPLVRAEAVRTIPALAKVVVEPGGVRAVAERLGDLWRSGDDGLRTAVAGAWAVPPMFEEGGREALRLAVSDGATAGALAAAGASLGAAQGDPELKTLAESVVVRALRDGSSGDRVRAAVVARLEGESLQALRQAAEAGEAGVRVVALGRLLGSEPDRARAVSGLEAIAGQGTGGISVTDPAVLTLAARAQFLLAQAGDVRVQAWIEEGLAAPRPFRRLEAASALAALGRSGRAAPLLADADPRVRTVAACTMIRSVQ